MKMLSEHIIALGLISLGLVSCGDSSEVLSSKTAAVTLPGPPNPGTIERVLPDLVIGNAVTGALRTTSANKILPVSVTVRNQTFVGTGGFKISATYQQPGGSEYTVAFNVPGQSELWYPRSNGLSGNGSSTFTGTLIFRGNLSGPVAIRFLVDSCSGEEFFPAYCHVRESREDNNYSLPFSVNL